jgi:hypothetical protein
MSFMSGSHTFVPGIHKVELRNPAAAPLTIGNGLELKYCPHLGPDELGCFSTRQLASRDWTYFEGMLCTSHGDLLPELRSHAMTCEGIGADSKGRGSTRLMGIRSVPRPLGTTAAQWLRELNIAADGLGAGSFVNSSSTCNAARPAVGFRSKETESTSKNGGGVYHTVDGCMEPHVYNLLPLKLLRDVPPGKELTWDYVVYDTVRGHQDYPSRRQRKRARFAGNQKKRLLAGNGSEFVPGFEGLASTGAPSEVGLVHDDHALHDRRMTASFRRRQSKKKGKRLAAANAEVGMLVPSKDDMGSVCPVCKQGVGTSRTNCIRCCLSYHPECLPCPGLGIYMCVECSAVDGPVHGIAHCVSFTEVMSGISTSAMALCEMRNAHAFPEINHLESIEIDKACELLCSELDEWRPPGQGTQPYKGMAASCRT